MSIAMRKAAIARTTAITIPTTAPGATLLLDGVFELDGLLFSEILDETDPLGVLLVDGVVPVFAAAELVADAVGVAVATGFSDISHTTSNTYQRHRTQVHRYDHPLGSD
jgi:hypothetical protein